MYMTYMCMQQCALLVITIMVFMATPAHICVYICMYMCMRICAYVYIFHSNQLECAVENFRLNTFTSISKVTMHIVPILRPCT